jgi:hypothetical protein
LDDAERTFPLLHMRLAAPNRYMVSKVKRAHPERD